MCVYLIRRHTSNISRCQGSSRTSNSPRCAKSECAPSSSLWWWTGWWKPSSKRWRPRWNGICGAPIPLWTESRRSTVWTWVGNPEKLWKKWIMTVKVPDSATFEPQLQVGFKKLITLVLGVVIGAMRYINADNLDFQSAITFCCFRLIQWKSTSMWSSPRSRILSDSTLTCARPSWYGTFHCRVEIFAGFLNGFWVFLSFP